MSDTPAPYATRRSPLSPATPATDAAFEAEGPGSQPAESSLTAALRAVERFAREARAAFPNYNVEAGLTVSSNGIHGTGQPQWKVAVSGQPLRAPAQGFGASPRQALDAARGALGVALAGARQQQAVSQVGRRQPAVSCPGCGRLPGTNPETCTPCYQAQEARAAA